MTESPLWTVDNEVQLFHALRKSKPVGVNKHFNMLRIHEKLRESIHKEITADDIWRHLRSMYDLQALDDSDLLPFPNPAADFALPEEEYGELTNANYPRSTSIEAAINEDKHHKEPLQGAKVKAPSVEKHGDNSPKRPAKRGRPPGSTSTPQASSPVEGGGSVKRRRT